MLPEASSARGFNEQQREAYWAANTLLQAIFPSPSLEKDLRLTEAGQLAEERQRAAASLVGMGLRTSDFKDALTKFHSMDYSALQDLHHMQRMGLSIEQVFSWIRAPETALATDQVATREELLSTWGQGVDRSIAINRMALSGQIQHGLGALLAVGCVVAAGAFHGAGYGLDNSAMTQTGQIMLESVPEAWNPMKNIDVRDLGGQIAAGFALALGVVGVRALWGEKDKNLADARRTNLDKVLSQKQLGDTTLMEMLSAIPTPHTCLLSHLSREDLELFAKGDDVLRKAILIKDPPDYDQRRQFAYLEAKNTWDKIMLQLDVSLLKWTNRFSETGCAAALSEMRQTRQRAQPLEDPQALAAPTFSVKPA